MTELAGGPLMPRPPGEERCLCARSGRSTRAQHRNERVCPDPLQGTCTCLRACPVSPWEGDPALQAPREGHVLWVVTAPASLRGTEAPVGTTVSKALPSQRFEAVQDQARNPPTTARWQSPGLHVSWPFSNRRSRQASSAIQGRACGRGRDPQPGMRARRRSVRVPCPGLGR